ncbi:MAG: hypothetical protein IPK65_08860 [Gammaproteobacteria bacterium]|nr:hypothetical protein [Gammaproteobacteria bacterium]
MDLMLANQEAGRRHPDIDDQTPPIAVPQHDPASAGRLSGVSPDAQVLVFGKESADFFGFGITPERQISRLTLCRKFRYQRCTRENRDYEAGLLLSIHHGRMQYLLTGKHGKTTGPDQADQGNACFSSDSHACLRDIQEGGKEMIRWLTRHPVNRPAVLCPAARDAWEVTKA